MKKYIVEFLGTFFLVLTVALSADPIAIGFMLMAMIYMGGYISGAHYNPAITLGLLISENIKWEDAKKYIAAQLLGGFIASGVFAFLKQDFFQPSPSSDASFLQAFFVEVLFTFALVSVVHHVAVQAKTKGNQYYGLAIGMTVMAAAIAGGPISGGAFNPAVGVSPLVFDITSTSAHISAIFLYSLGPIVGGVLAGLVYKKLS